MAFTKQNATATNLSPKLLDATPANYTSLGSLIDPTKPDVRDLYIQTFGDQGITGLLDVTGAKRSAGTADEVHWYEEGRINRRLSITTSSGTATIQDAYGYVAASMTADQVVQLNDILLTEGGEIIKSVKAYPNPYPGFSLFDGIAFKWDAAGTGNMRIKIFNPAGEMVRVLDSTIEAESAVWDLKTTSNSKVAHGFYICIIEAVNSQGRVERERLKVGITYSGVE